MLLRKINVSAYIEYKTKRGINNFVNWFVDA